MSTQGAVEMHPEIRLASVFAKATLLALLAYTVLAMAWGTAFEDSLAFSAGPVNVYAFDLLLMVSVALLLLQFLAADTARVPRSNAAVVALVLGYCAYQLAVILPIAVVLFRLDPVSVARDIENRVALILIPFVYLVVLRHVTPRRLILLVNVAAVVLVLFAVYTYFTAGPVYQSGFRLRTVWGGAILLFAFLILTSLFLARHGIAAYGAAVLGLVGIALTNHRSGYVALLAVGAPLFFYFRRASARTIAVLLVVAASAALLLAVAPNVRESAFYSLETMLNPNADSTAQDRVERSRLGWDYFVANPLGDYTWSHRYYLVNVGPEDFEPHNFIVQILSQQGIVGLAFFLAIVLAVGRIAWRNRARGRLSAVMLACLAFYLLFCLFNTNIMNPWNIMLLAVPAGLILHENDDLAKAGGPEARVPRGSALSAGGRSEEQGLPPDDAPGSG